MNEDIEALRKAMQAASPTGRGNYVEDGQHVLQVEKALCKRTLIDGRWKESYIIEFKVLQSSNPKAEVGSSQAYIENPENAGWMGRFKAALLACTGFDPAGKIPAEVEAKMGDIIAALRYDEFRTSQGWPENFLAGCTVRCEGTPGKSRAGTPVTNKKWYPYTPPAAPAGG